VFNLGGSVSPDLIGQWLDAMGDPVFRGVVEAAVAALYGLLAWLLGEIPILKKLPEAPRRLLWVMWAGAGAVLAFFVCYLIPGFELKELAPAMGGGGGLTGLLARSPLHKKLFPSEKGRNDA
jgi:hypothetical protein